MGNELAGKVAVVTGGASGLGAGIVERFLAEGASVVFGDIDVEQGQALADSHDKALFLPTDVAATEQLSALIDSAVEKFGRLDVMVNNAGISHKMHRSFLDDDLAEFEKVMAVNLKAVMAGTRDAARHMRDSGGGSIINLTSIGGIQAGGGVMSYRASKAAVIHFTQCAAIELAKYEVRVNCLAPGHIRTAIVSKSAHGMDAEQVAKFEAGIRETMRQDRPLEREGTAADVAEAILFFAGDRSPYVTGTVLPVDGGTAAGKPIPKKKKPQDS
ncbi:NAD(P)-dependent dehydrogenase (short-subunit alcohol dehydrogenase family) [Mycolicibacterium sp. BK556]|uniref:SDR family NAD(P)-dependent oxidoreductase n=1 Tax=Mycobacteriaceae TaxID=1762 RepID=UPI00105C0E76|nr:MULTISPECIES: SDR family oxidoreductase [Mycobacteriaceae]MBB3602968.1 NAD(P)-dependent dehydrogenase (short-subunit alcohol dehydrogenase family) [Mycolicibacterium sp. BK556]MBB3633163.1 NAD(P)-dependent dehydrogenase (short-subunit alcohol dehydrogenase family) [Mycolicibacterium sp. BK607]TDO07137.1 NAD(P)-dependent dehydrogenase (short-subunit alcohol dehydrogenase family) [Mycobacterium sp. BK086]